MEYEFMTIDTPLPPSMPLPRAMLRLPISSTAKIMYARMLDDVLANGIEDMNGILFICCLIFTVPAYAQSSEPQPETMPAPVETEAEPETQNPFTPDGTGTVVDNATDEDGKEFYTITTADESVFYLVIDKQKTSENVYFLNTVTTDDLLPLAEQGKEPPKEVTPEPEPKPTEPVEEVPEPEPEKKDSPLLSLLLIGAVVLAGGGIGYYFKIYKPKHEAPDLEDDYCEYEDGELEEIAEEPEDEDTPPWEEDTEE